jgi:ABC-type Fe3+-hydroxamate transport system substrate-binding protein
MKKLIILFFAASVALSACHSNDKKTDRQSDTSAAKGSGGPADSAKSTAPGNSAVTPNSSDTSSLHGDTDSAVHPVH